jgi:hypothetical protein
MIILFCFRVPEYLCQDIQFLIEKRGENELWRLFRGLLLHSNSGDCQNAGVGDSILAVMNEAAVWRN